MLRRGAKTARTKALVGFVGVMGLLLGLTPAEPAVAWNTGSGTGNITFDVGGSLNPFPCGNTNGCDTHFSGTGTGGGTVTALVGGVPHEATFIVEGGYVGGWANYSETTGTLCPVFGDAKNINGNVTLSGSATGIIRKVQALPTAPGGSITNVTYSADFIYTRVGANAYLQFTSGSISIDYHIPADGVSGTIRQPIVTGSGTAVFKVDAQEATARCVFPGPLGYRLIGDANLETAAA